MIPSSVAFAVRHMARDLLDPLAGVHAIDLRIHGPSEFRNRLVQGYFEVMGFKTLCHKGSADHLHVALPRR